MIVYSNTSLSSLLIPVFLLPYDTSVRMDTVSENTPAEVSHEI